mgnify:CR=1 FL=1
MHLSFLRKQESRLLCACYVFVLGKRELWNTFWIPTFAGMTIENPSPGLAFGQVGLSRQ